jgi:hypothetical protein
MRNIQQFLNELEKHECSKWDYIQAWEQHDKKRMQRINEHYKELKRRFEGGDYLCTQEQINQQQQFEE